MLSLGGEPIMHEQPQPEEQTPIPQPGTEGEPTGKVENPALEGEVEPEVEVNKRKHSKGRDD